MKQNGIYRGEWAGCSDFKERRANLQKAHEEFQKMLDNGFKVSDVKVKHKRPRIKEARQPKQVVVTLGGEWTVTLSFEEYKKRGSGLKIVMRIY